MIEASFLEYSAKKLEQLSTRLQTCLDALSDEQIWLRMSDMSNAPGNIVLHLCGNVRQWIIAGLGGKPDIRVRDREFSTRSGLTREELKERLNGIVTEAAAIIRALPPQSLAGPVTIQGHDLEVYQAVYHVVEHFSGHTGQMIFVAKALTQKDFGFYSYVGTQQASKHIP